MNEFDEIDQNEKAPETTAEESTESYPISGSEAVEEARKAAEEEEARQREIAAEEAARLAEEQREYNEWLEKRQQEQAARDEAENAAKKKKRKKGLAVAGILAAVLLIGGACTYAASNLIGTIRDLKAQVNGYKSTEGQDIQREFPSQSDSSFQSRPSDDRVIEKGTDENKEKDRDRDKESTLPAVTVEDGEPVVETAEALPGGSGVVLTDVSDIVEQAMPSMVSVNVTALESYSSGRYGNRQREVEGAGSGVIIGDNGSELWIVTNNHVVESAISLNVTFIDNESAEAYIKGTDADNDLAVIGVKIESLKESTMKAIRTITIGESDTLCLGDGVIAIGNALGWGQSVTTGVVSAFDRTVTFEDGTSMVLMQVSAAINPGNSGGALLNEKGELIGINNAKYSDTDVEGVGFAIPISGVQDVMRELSLMAARVEVSEEDYPYLGIVFQNLSSSYVQLYGMPEGAYVYEVGEDTPAEKAGILRYDFITAFNGEKVSSYDDLINIMKYYSGGTEVTITLMRLENGKYVDKEVTLTLGYKKDYQSN
ncbi:MAG: trypsin-like peptidase domain-containing protein [Lachnospiraceae bacterium]|nr:trypsin-like peptidase domain-containing protein [Lachnospiraceae bacterium]